MTGKRINLDDLKIRMATEWAMQPQKTANANTAIEQIKAGLADLAKLGYMFDLVERGADGDDEPEEFPKMLYKGDEQLTVGDKVSEEAARKQGFDDHQAIKEALRTGPQGGANNPSALVPGMSPHPTPNHALDQSNTPKVAPKPVMTDKEVTEKRIEENKGASTPNVNNPNTKDDKK